MHEITLAVMRAMTPRRATRRNASETRNALEGGNGAGGRDEGVKAASGAIGASAITEAGRAP